MVVEILDSGHVELSNGLTMPLNELRPVATDERWVELKGVTVPYLLSDQGKVVSLRYARQDRERMLRAPVQGRYPQVNLLLEKRPKNYAVARLVAQHFLPPPAEARHTRVLHRDQNPLNTHYTNLQWVDKAEIQDVFIDRLLRRRGQDHYRAKLTPEKVSQLRNRAGQGEMLKALAQEFGVTSSAISHIVRGRTWRTAPTHSPIPPLNSSDPQECGTQLLAPWPGVDGEMRTAAGIPLVDYLRPGQPLRAGATVSQEGFDTQGFANSLIVIEVISAEKVKLSNGQTLPLAELQRVETQERWVFIQGIAARWLLSDQGKVVSVPYDKISPECLLRLDLRNDHPKIVLTRGKRQVEVKVAELVAEHFLPPPPNRRMKYALARDGDPLNLHYTNLEWAVNPEIKPKGILNHHLLSDEQVAEILSRHRQGQKLKQLAQAFGVSISTIGRITIRERDGHT
ncbi:hypothetical protein PK28_17365 (plasmid) [Hymenobacter sp. DG25B]|nr:hypothetical protein PK28_17365 [Hymenobacter sp. DG25B]